MIKNREELIDALTEAAELEHSLLIQYLFAAFTLKRRLDEGITPIQQAKIVSWERTILEVARQEMGHLGLVCNLLSAIGAAPRFGRANFPKSAEKYYPLVPEFTLSKFSFQTLYTFVCFELPIDLEPEKLLELKSFSPRAELFSESDFFVYNRVVDLYTQISDAFSTINEFDLFIGPKYAQDPEGWTFDVSLKLITDRESAQSAIDHIVLEGEGTTTNRENSHYLKFFKIWNELKTIDFDPARDVVDNPFTRVHRDNDLTQSINIITNESTRRVSELFNNTYTTMLLMLMQYYSYNGETLEQRTFLRNTLIQMMRGLSRPLSEILTELPMSDNINDGCAGPAFEIYSDLRLSPFIGNRWTILKERFAEAGKDAKSLTSIHPRMVFVSQNIDWILQNLNKVTENII